MYWIEYIGEDEHDDLVLSSTTTDFAYFAKKTLYFTLEDVVWKKSFPTPLLSSYTMWVGVYIFSHAVAFTSVDHNDDDDTSRKIWFTVCV